MRVACAKRHTHTKQMLQGTGARIANGDSTATLRGVKRPSIERTYYIPTKGSTQARSPINVICARKRFHNAQI